MMMRSFVLLSLLVVVCLAKYQPSFGVNSLPATFSWVDKGAVGNVKNQGQCGSSLEFGIVDSISSIYSIQNKLPYAQLSVQELYNCSDFGCNGQFQGQILDYIEQHGLSVKECPKGKAPKGVCIEGSTCVQRGNETALAIALIEQGPLFVAIDASNVAFEEYNGGIYDPPGCSSTTLDTTLLLVGFTQDAWICQNSWGADWGMNGYVEIARNKNNACGIASTACYPTGVAAC